MSGAEGTRTPDPHTARSTVTPICLLSWSYAAHRMCPLCTRREGVWCTRSVVPDGSGCLSAASCCRPPSSRWLTGSPCAVPENSVALLQPAHRRGVRGPVRLPRRRLATRRTPTSSAPTWTDTSTNRMESPTSAPWVRPTPTTGTSTAGRLIRSKASSTGRWVALLDRNSSTSSNSIRTRR